MAPKNRSVAPQTQPVPTFASPDLKDLVFWVDVDRTIPGNRKAKYGDPYYDSVNYPHHKLVYIAPELPNRVSRYYYAAEREFQDLYNWEHSDADLGGNRFKAITRTYVTLREKYDPLIPVMGSVMPSDPEGKFSEQYLLASRKEIRMQGTDQNLDSLFVSEQRGYIKRVTITNLGVRQKTGKSEQIVTTVYYRGEEVGGTPIEDLFANKTNVFWGTQGDGSFRKGEQISENWFSVSQGPFIDLEDAWKKSASRLRPSKFFCPQATTSTTSTTIAAEGEPADPAPALGEEIIVEKVGTIQSSTLVEQEGDPGALPGLNALEDGFAYPTLQTLTTPGGVPSSRQPVDSSGKITEYLPVDPCNSIAETKQLVSPETEYKKTAERRAPQKYFAEGLVTVVDAISFDGSPNPSDPLAILQQQSQVHVKGKIKHVITTAQVGEPQVLSGTTFDERTGETFLITEELVPLADVIEGGVDSEGNLVTYSPIDANYAVETTRKLISTAVRTFSDVVNYEWPPVLLAINDTIWNAKGGRGSAVFSDFVIKKAFSGPQVAVVTQWWQKDPYTITPPVAMLPQSMDFHSPLFSINVPPCLHSAYTFSCTIGTSDPEWQPGSYSKFYSATNYTDWPDSITWEAVQPHAGGYLVTTHTLNKPS